MPRQNRVTPFGTLIADPARGTLMGNRGCLHDADGRIVRDQTTRRWIICLTDFKGRRRQIMKPGHYTELFFLDEVTALAAGHRPCAECQRDRYRAFLAAAGYSRADTLDRALEAARHMSRPMLGMLTAPLPDGAFVGLGGKAFLWRGGTWHAWSPSGYRPAPSPGPRAHVLTPSLTRNALTIGYRPRVMP